MDSLRALIEGYAVARVPLGLFGKLKPETAFTMPSVFQLLAHPGFQEFYDDRLRPKPVDLYELETWRRNRWSIFDPSYRNRVTKKMQKRLGPDWQLHFADFFTQREAYLKAVLDRARLFAAALDVKADLATQLKVFILTGDCERTLRAGIIDENGSDIRTLFRPRKLDTGITAEQAAAKLFEPGDGRVTRGSALAISHGQPSNDLGGERNLSVSIFGCEIHGDLPNNPAIQDNMLSIFLK